MISIIWGRLKQLTRLLLLIRFSILVAGIGILAVYVDQGQEALIVMGQNFLWVRFLALFLATTFTAGAVWYFGRIMYLFQFSDPTVSFPVKRTGST
ncbi:MAG: hypothetical protein GKS05_04400 [Nitrospirales bacterium]|nr:hypothetical protein [Nitrospirales bacterium]